MRAGAECGYLPVPLDHDEPGGPTIELAVSRVRHTTPDDQYQGVMLVNPGGPGASGLGLAVLGRFVPNNAGASYDWIGFDPRGVGVSRPSLSCDPNRFSPDRPDYIPRTRELERTWLQRSKDYAEACGDKGGDLLDHITTADVARDMDLIRAAVGEPAINYYGFSWGTYLGQVYSSLYPKRVRRMVLDSNVNPRRIWYQANLDQDLAFDQNITIFFRWMADHDDVYHLGTTAEAVEQQWYEEQDKLRAEAAGGVVGPDEWTDIFLGAGYSQGAWPGLGTLFADWVRTRDPAPLIAAYEGADSPGNDNLAAVYNATMCTDVQWPTDWDRWKRDNWRTHREAPFMTWANVWAWNAPCLFWPAKAHTPVRVDGRRVASALLLSETLDAATPFEGNLEVRRRYPNASLIATKGGTTHANSLAGNACVDDRIAAYLATGERPPRVRGDRPDVTCEPLPEPVPDPPVAAPVAAAAPAGAPMPAATFGLGATAGSRCSLEATP